ncbi:MAG: NUDIX domain-containing protein [Limnochordaceae bacterium]|nr:NUDIX domain-containing protein [Limnochordaceae bacterium]
MRAQPTVSTVRCRTLFGGEKEFAAAELTFRPAAYGLAVWQGKVLLGRSVFTGLFDIPGGGVEPWESIEEGMCREYREETGVTPVAARWFTFRESYFAFHHPFHSLRFYYLVALPPAAYERPQEVLHPQLQEIRSLSWVDPTQCRPEEFSPGDWNLVQEALREAALHPF